MCNYLKRILFLSIFLILTFSFFAAEKGNLSDQKDIASLDSLNNHIKFSFNNLNNNNNNDYVYSKDLYTYTGFQSRLYRNGLYLIGFGGASALLGGTLFGLSYLLNWYCANAIGWSYENVILNMFLLESVFNIQSYYATVAMAFWISGIVFMALSIMIIPGIILMAIDMGSSVKRRRIYPLREAVGFVYKF